MDCKKCGLGLAKHNKSGFCYRHLADEQHRLKRLELRRSKSILYCNICGKQLQHLTSKTGLCTDCYRYRHNSQRNGHLFSMPDMLYVLINWQSGRCWWCGGLIIGVRIITGHHIYPHTLMPLATAEENCGVCHGPCHKELHIEFPKIDDVVELARIVDRPYGNKYSNNIIA